MSQTPYEARQGEPSGGPLGVVAAMGMGWQFLKVDFWPIWLVGLVAMVLLSVAESVGAIPYIGGCIAAAVSVFIQPPVTAGLYYAIGRRIDGGAADVSNIFAGFRERYWQSVVAFLPPMLAGAAVGIVIMVLAIGLGLGAAMLEGHHDEAPIIAALIIAGVVLMPLIIAVVIFSLFFAFCPITVWQHPQSGWEAAKASMRFVKDNFWSVLGMTILFALIGLAAAIVGLLACCVGLFFTVPVVMVWEASALTFFYRSRTGQALIQAQPERTAV